VNQRLNNRSGFFVHIDLGDGVPVVAGRHVIDFERNIGQFIYGNSYLNNPKAVAIDPVHLPLKAGEVFDIPITRMAQSGIWPVLLDSGPDDWGKFVLNQSEDIQPVSEADYLVLASGSGAGALFFSDTPTEVNEPEFPNHSTVADLYQAAEDLEAGRDVSEEFRLCLINSSGIGGARPKAQVESEGAVYIAKFNRISDSFDNALAEYAFMKLCKKAGIDVAEVDLLETAKGNIVLVERFDNPLGARTHLLSAHSLLNPLEVKRLSDIGYSDIAKRGQVLSGNPQDSDELFLRMIFNIAIGNTDDHTRNHAYIKTFDQRQYQLSPAYDVVPLPERLGAHAINVGPFGKRPTIDNIRASGKLMGLNTARQDQLMQQVLHSLSNVGSYLRGLGVSDKDIAVLKPALQFCDLIANTCGSAFRIDQECK
jgi:serine/threonine-protein kinase HipA